MAKRFHINDKGEAKQCYAQVRCRFGGKSGAANHYPTKEAAQAAYERAQEERALRSLRKKLVGATKEKRRPLSYPEPFVASSEDLQGNLWRVKEAITMPDHDWDSSIQEEDYSIDPWAAVELYTGTRRGEWPREFTALVEERASLIADPRRWQFSSGYYGELETVVAAPALEEVVDSYRASHPGVKDQEGVLEHVRGKGFETTGLSPVEALKKMLREENGGQAVAAVEEATRVRRVRLGLKELKRAERHYERLTPEEPVAPFEGQEVVHGVIVASRAGGYRLMDGHHRLRYLEEAGEGEGLFFLLER